MIATFSAQFTLVDWLVVFSYLALTTWIGVAMAGRQATIHDFFLGGRKLPWYAVSGSIVASEISALTFVSVPWVVFQPGGNLTYLQLGVFGSLIARVIVAYWLVPAFYRREIYSPFDYMHNQLGGNIRQLTTVLFVIKAMLAQSSRIYLASEVIVVVMNDQLVWLTQRLGLNELAWAIIIISSVSIAWTFLGGMRTVIWTDVALFACFALGSIVALGTVIFLLPGGLSEMLRIGWDAKTSGWPQYGLPVKESGEWGKFTFFDWSTSPVRTYTMWTAMIASTWGGIGSYGLDQTLAQRIFCCKDQRDARWAIISSAVSQLVTITCALVGIGLYAYYQSHPLSGQALELFQKKGDRILPIFVVEVVPMGLKGMIIAAIFAAAISTMMGVLTATSQTTLTAYYNPLRQRYLRSRGVHAKLSENIEHQEPDQADDAEHRLAVRVSRALVLFWGISLAALSYFMVYVAAFYPSILDLGLAMAGYILGAMLAGFLLSFFPLNVDSRGYMFAAPLSCMCVFALIWHQSWAQVTCWAAAAILFVAWMAVIIVERSTREKSAPVLPPPIQTAILVFGIALMMALCYFGYWPGPADASGNVTYQNLAWPWQIPIGTTIAFLWGIALARRQVGGEKHER